MCGSQRSLCLAVSLLLLASGAAAAAVTSSTTISNGTADERTAFRHFDAPSAALADFDGDGRAEIVAHNENRVVYVLASDRAAVLAEIHPPYPSWGARAISEPVVADVDADGRLDIVVVTSAASVCVFEHQGSFAFTQSWCRRMDAHYASPGADGGPWVEDVTGDGRAEIFAQGEERGLYAFNPDGSVRWSKGESGGNAGPLVTDLEGDGRKEVLFFSDNGWVRAYDASSGVPRWDFEARRFVYPAAIPVAGSAADLDGDGRQEVVFTARHATDTSDYRNNHLMLFVLDASGNVRWRVQPSFAHPLSYTHPLLVDVNGDGRRDVVLQDWNTIGHKPGNWEQLGPAHVFAYSHAGSLLWRRDLPNGWSNDDLLLADADGDGRQDLVAIGWGSQHDGLWLLDPATGAPRGHLPVPGWVVNRAPIAGDLDGSGRLSLVVPGTSGSAGALVVLRTDAPCRVAFGGWSVRSPCDPPSQGADGGAAPPPPPPATGFDAEFRNPRGNGWWVETNVDANEPLAGVDARVDGGSWIALSRTDWGSWAKPFRVADGSVVEFRARSTSGGQEVSGGYRWPDATPTSAPPQSAPTDGRGDFTADFRNPRGNSWWVETDVAANEPLAGVDARVDGGAWTALSKTSWGSWAKSFHVPSGATVEFRARSADGDVAVSQGHRWPPS